MEKECELYVKDKGRKVRCSACVHRCFIQNKKAGICGIRINLGGKLFLMNYGKIASMNVDPIEKKPLYHFLLGTKSFSIGTSGCNFRCGFCQNFEISQLKGIIGDEYKIENIFELAIKNKCKSISYTYNEPTIFIEFVHDMAKFSKMRGLKNVLVTNGYETKECIDFISPYVDAMNIDLKSFSEEFYSKNCGAKLKPILETIKYAYQKKIWIEITTLVVPGENDSEKEMEEIAKFIASIDKNIPWHISRFFPMHKMSEKNATDISFLKKTFDIGRKYLNYVYVGNIDVENPTVCPKCGIKIIERYGYSTKSNLRLNVCFNCGEKIAGVWE